MIKIIVFVAIVLSFLHPENTNKNVKQEIIQQSINAYPGRCPCPYNMTKNGSQCGKRSAWSNGIAEWNYKDGEENGFRKQYYDTGELNLVTFMKDGKKDGQAKAYYKSGALAAEMNFKGGKFEGIQKGYYESGNYNVVQLVINLKHRRKSI